VAEHMRISKLLSLMLRHRPEEFGLNMDPYGFILLDEVIRAVQERYPEVVEEDIRTLVEGSEQRRFEIGEKGIRALYGHSFFVEMDGEPMDPPEYLYMGCLSQDIRRFRTEGIMPVDRFYVHLSVERETAEERSKQADGPCVVQILARRAQEKGVQFFSRGNVALTRGIPPEFVGEFFGLEEEGGQLDSLEDGKEPQGGLNYGRRPRKATGRRR